MSNAESDLVRLETDGGVAVVTLNRPERHNALTPAMASRLVEILDRIETLTQIAVLVLRAEGPSFCAGADRATLADVSLDPLSDLSFQNIDEIYSSFVRLGNAAVPTIAAIRGAAVGAGLNLAMAADLRIVASDARLLSGFLSIGLHPGGGHYRLLSAAARPEVGSALGLFGVELTGEQAVEKGLAWQHVPSASVDETAISLARTVSNPRLMRRAVQSFRAQTREALSWSAALELERSPQLWSFRALHD